MIYTIHLWDRLKDQGWSFSPQEQHLQEAQQSAAYAPCPIAAYDLLQHWSVSCDYSLWIKIRSILPLSLYFNTFTCTSLKGKIREKTDGSSPEFRNAAKGFYIEMSPRVLLDRYSCPKCNLAHNQLQLEKEKARITNCLNLTPFNTNQNKIL